jgi:general stress protein 26
MAVTTSIDEALRTARDLVCKVPNCFVVTNGLDGEPNARIVRHGPLREDWSIGFMTERWCRKVKEIEHAGRFALAFQCDEDAAYVTLHGAAQFIEDEPTKAAAWSAESNRFHLGGPADPNVVIVRLMTDRIELYSGAAGIQPDPPGLNSFVLTRHNGEWRQGKSSTKIAA